MTQVNPANREVVTVKAERTSSGREIAVVRRAADDYLGPDRITRITPSRRWRMADPRELWAYRELLWVLTARDIKVRYKQTLLGAAWAIIQPLLTMVLFSIVFGYFARMPSEGYPYPVFVYTGLVAWTFFASAITGAAGSVIGSSNLISKVYFPRLIIPLATAGPLLIDLAIATSVLLMLMAWFGIPWTLQLLAVPVIVAGLALTAVGFGTVLAALTVSYRDIRYIIPFLVQFWMYATPIVYSPTLIPERWRWLLALNPLTGFVDGFRSAFLGKPFDWPAIAASVAIGIAVFVVAIAYFESTERRFADVI